ncbi:MAG: SagB/ThcOx family dehydrogenase [Deltaproteobacteria bacterium]|nr:SagB/ThcOx family dehydrogenase [Deltaproteobacteria bacterium]
MDQDKVIQLPRPVHTGKMSLEETILRRESVRDFTSKPLTLQEFSQLLWAAQGITRKWGGRAAPSAGALYPLEVYLVTAEGFFHYLPARHHMIPLSDRNLLKDLCHAALGQSCTREAPAVIVLTAVHERTSGKYGPRAERYIAMEAGHAAQNILLQATALGLGALPVGAFYDDRVQKALGLPGDHQPLYLIPVGHPR